LSLLSNILWTITVSPKMCVKSKYYQGNPILKRRG